MKKLITILVFVIVSQTAQGQDVKGSTGEFLLNIEKPSEVELVWVNPPRASFATEKDLIELTVGVNSSEEISSINVFLNDLKVSDRGLKVIEEKNNFDQLYKRDITLNQGENVIRMEVELVDGTVVKEDRIITVTGEYADVMNRRDIALIFATDEYDEWKNLVNPVNDAKTIGKELEQNYGFQVEMVLNPTLDEIWAKLREYTTKSYLDNDQLFIFFAGHGQFDEQFNEGFLVAKDSKLSDVGKTSYISYNRLRPLIDLIPVNHIMLAMDACFGGTFDPLVANAGSRGEDNIYEEVNQLEYIKRKLRYKTRRFITSGGKEYVPDGRPGMHSPFARKFLEALREEGGADGVLTLQELNGYVEKLTPEPRAGEFGSNEPGSDFVFVLKR